MLSIVIITYNEEETLERLLQCIRRQKIKAYEVIVSDADSTDNTRAVAKRFRCKIVPGGSSPGEGRNNGGFRAKGDMILFLDADSLIPDDFLYYGLSYMKLNNVEVACTYLKPDSAAMLDTMMMEAYNAYQFVTQPFWAHAVGACIFCKKELFNRLGGFDISISHAEDMDFVKRAARIAKFRIIPSIRLTFCMRRYRQEGMLTMALKLIASEIHRAVLGEIRNPQISRDLIKYETRRDWLNRTKMKEKPL